MHRRKTSYRVCRCTPTNGITQIETRLLMKIVARGMHAVGCAHDTRRKAQRGLLLGDICASSGHPYWAIRIWNKTRQAVQSKDWDDWIWTPINHRLFRLADLTAEAGAKELGRRIDQAWQAMGHSEMTGYEAAAEMYYEYLWEEKYEVCLSDIPDCSEPEEDTSAILMAEAMHPWPLQLIQEWG